MCNKSKVLNYRIFAEFCECVCFVFEICISDVVKTPEPVLGFGPRFEPCGFCWVGSGPVTLPDKGYLSFYNHGGTGLL